MNRSDITGIVYPFLNAECAFKSAVPINLCSICHDAQAVDGQERCEECMTDKPINKSPYQTAHERECAGYLPTLVTMRVQGDITLTQLGEALKAGGLEVYKDCTEALCLRTIAAGDAHRELVRAERAARAEHARRHAELVREEGERNKANGYRSPAEQGGAK